MFSLNIALLLSPGYKAQSFHQNALWIVVQYWMDRNPKEPWSYELFQVNNKAHWLSYGTRDTYQDFVHDLQRAGLDEDALIWEPIGWIPPQHLLLSQLPETSIPDER